MTGPAWAWRPGGPGEEGEQVLEVRSRTRTVLAWALWLVTFGCCAAGLLVTLVIYRPLTLAVLAEGAVYAFVFVLGFATVGLVLALRRPGNPIGWLYGGAGLAWAYTIPVAPWIDQLVREHRPLPLVAQVVAATGDLSWAPAIALGITLPALLLPDGHLRSHRWRLVVIASVTGSVLIIGASTLAPGPLEEMGIDNPFGLAGQAGHVAAVLTIVGVVLHWLSLPPAAVCVVLRFRSSRGVERQQMRWVAAGVAGAVAGLLIGLPGGLGIAPGWISNIVFPALLCPPVAVGVAVLRYRLYDLDRIISRTLTYGLLTVLLGLGYAAVVLGLGRLLPEGSSLAVAAATLAAAAAFSPLRRRVQGLVDRRFNRHRYDAAGTVEAFAARLRDQVDLDALHTELLAVVDQTVQPTRASRGCAARRGSPRVPVVGAVGSARGRRRPAPDLLHRCSRRRPAEVKGTSSSRDAGRVPSSRGRRERGSRGRPRAEEHQMTRQKSFKSRVRARMDKTSESYTTARRQLLAKAGAEPPPEPRPAGPVAAPPAVAPEPQPAAPVAAAPGARRPYSDEVIRTNTGRTWDEWFALLDAWGGAQRPHPEIARWLVEEHGVGGWWAQGVTVGYEQARGLRDPGQRRGGLYEANASKTVAVPVERLYEAFADPALRERWLPGAAFQVRTARPGRSIRANWDDGSTRLVVAFTARGEARTQVALVHERIPDAATADRLKAWWRERVAILKQVLEA